MINFFTYVLLFGSMLFVIKRGELSGNKKLIYCGYIILFVVSALRYDIGNDYFNYWLNTEDLASQYRFSHSVKDVYNYSDGRFEIGFCVLVSLFSWSENAFFWISMTFSLLVVLGLYTAFEKCKCHFWGMLLVIVTEYIFLQWDWIRQSGAFTFVLLSMLAAKDKKFSQFVIFVLIASLFHKSSIFMLVAYPLTYVKMNNKLIFLILIAALVIYWSGILDSFVNQLDILFSYVDGYDKYDSANVALSFTHTTIFSRIRVSLFVLLGALVVLTLDGDNAFYRNAITVGLFVYMLSGSTLLLIRIAWYFLVILFPCFGICMQSSRHKNLVMSYLLISLLSAQIAVFSYDVATGTNTRGCVPYKSIFSDDFANHRFDIRDYK